ncbi:MAG TPA: hypothetical protein V6D22_02555 [Candidatus Obscuribacterales bacterium]
MPDEKTTNKTSNVSDISLGLLVGGVLLLAVGTRLRLLMALPLWLLGTVATAGGASLRPEVNQVVSGLAGEEKLWVKLKSSVSVMKSAQEIYDYWRSPHNWPKFMPDVDIVQLGTDRYELTKRVAPALELRQQFMIVEDLPYHRIAWVSLGEELPFRGSVEFTTNGGTYVTLTWEYKLAIGAAVNSMSKQLLRGLNEVLLLKLQRCKQILETGGATTFGATACRSSSAEMLFHVWKSDANRAFADLTEPATSDA